MVRRGYRYASFPRCEEASKCSAVLKLAHRIPKSETSCGAYVAAEAGTASDLGVSGSMSHSRVAARS